jgi:hypothetical protein
MKVDTAVAVRYGVSRNHVEFGVIMQVDSVIVIYQVVLGYRVGFRRTVERNAVIVAVCYCVSGDSVAGCPVEGDTLVIVSCYGVVGNCVIERNGKPYTSETVGQVVS